MFIIVSLLKVSFHVIIEQVILIAISSFHVALALPKIWHLGPLGKWLALPKT